MVAAAGVDLDTDRLRPRCRPLPGAPARSCPTPSSTSCGASTPSSSVPWARRWARPTSRRACSSGACSCGCASSSTSTSTCAPSSASGRGARAGLRLRRHPGEHRGHLRRRGRVPPSGHALRGGHPGLGEHPHRRRALRALRLRARRPGAEASPHPGAQDQRPHLLRRPVAADLRRGGRRVPRRDARLQPRRRGLHLLGRATRPLRRHRHRQPLRRHPHRPGRRGGRGDRLRRLGQPEPGPHRARRCSSPSTAPPTTSPARARPTRRPRSARPR